jgi:hypothetical protein
MDAKYYKNTFVEGYMSSDESRIRTGHLNQVRGYVLDSKFKGEKFGALIYPYVSDDLSKGVLFPIKDSKIIVKTIDLNDDSVVIFCYEYEVVNYGTLSKPD